MADNKNCHPQPSNEELSGILRTVRDVPPAHYTFQIKSFSSLLEGDLERYESSEFEAGGYKWYLALYPNGNTDNNGNGHISLYLVIAETSCLPIDSEVIVNFKLFVFDQIRGKYLTIQDSEVRRFHKMKDEWGFSQLVSLDIFNDSTKGYLVNDCCVFGTEVFVIKGTKRGETLSIIKNPQNCCYTWKIDKFSTLDKKFLYSDLFTICGRKWKFLVYPKGDANGTGIGLSLYLMLDRSEIFPPRCKLYVKFKLRANDQINGNHYELPVSRWFCLEKLGCGFARFLSQANLNDISKGYLVNDRLSLEVQINAISEIEYFS